MALIHRFNSVKTKVGENIYFRDTAFDYVSKIIVRKSIRVDEICNTFGYSKSFLSRLFREHTGESLLLFAKKCKIKRAKELLRGDALKTTQISARLSFDNPQYFARVFRRVYGMTPTE